MKKLIAGNWKMNTDRSEANALASSVARYVADDPQIVNKCDILLCPPFVYIPDVISKCDSSSVFVGAQDCSFHENGAYTSEISANMLSDIGCGYVIAGHSERRQYHNETSDIVSNKACSAYKSGIIAIICVGESEEERDSEIHKSVVKAQLTSSVPDNATSQNTVIAYEPVWAIGTGKTASPEDVFDMHKFIRAELEMRFSDGKNFRILYGGSMKPNNAGELLSIPNVDGGLIGGASLKAEEFIAIAQKA